MILLRFDQTFLNANTYILADLQQKIAVVVDPGAGSRFWIKEALASLNLELGAVLLTHGHADHVWDVSAIVDNQPVYIPQPDLYRLTDPLAHLGMPQYALAFPRMGVETWIKPQNVLPVPDNAYQTGWEIVPGVVMRALATPGHTEGSSVFLFDGQSQPLHPNSVVVTDRVEHFMLSGDVLFQNGIGRTDLPGGDAQKMVSSLRFLVNVIRPETQILPGHGPHTNMFHETRHSDFLHKAMS